MLHMRVSWGSMVCALTVALSGVTADARVGREMHQRYLAAMEATGGCAAEYRTFIKTVEGIYTRCRASDEQFKELYSAIDKAKPVMCDLRIGFAMRAQLELGADPCN